MAIDRMFVHEFLFRGAEVVKQLKTLDIRICGAGALGGNLAVELARTGFQNITVIDRDRVETHNLGTQPYGKEDVTYLKAEVLRNRIFRDIEISISAKPVELTSQNVGKFLRGADLVIDTFDNMNSRLIVTDFCTEEKIECLHAGMSFDGYSEVIWNEEYTVPNDIEGPDVCDYPLARTLIGFTVQICMEILLNFKFSKGIKTSRRFTLGDMLVSSFD